MNALRDENDKKDPRASVLLQESFENLPPCLFIVAELDPLRDDSYSMNRSNSKFRRKYFCTLDYQKKLEEAGVKTNLVLVKNVIHSFFSLPGKIYHT
jgi:acetyl esterase